jgi:hypothetical protein
MVGGAVAILIGSVLDLNFKCCTLSFVQRNDQRSGSTLADPLPLSDP